MTSSALSGKRFGSAADELDLNRLARPALAVAVLASGLLIYHLTRGSSFSPDDWTWIVDRRGNTLSTFLAPYNGHLSLVPLVIYRMMFALFGIGSFVPYRLLLFGVASATGLVVFEYARWRVGEFCALLVATLMLFLGPGWNDIMQPFQIAWLLAVAAAILALSLLDRRRIATDIAACLLILVSISSTSVGVAFALGIAVDIAICRRRWRDAWIIAVPLLLYVVWTVHYHPSVIQLSSLTTAPLNLVQTTAAAMAGIVGLADVTPADVTGLSLMLGATLLLLALATLLVSRRTARSWARFLSLTVALVTFSLLTSLVRSFQSPLVSRYMYVTCVVVTLMGLELVRNLSVRPRFQLVLAGLTLAAVVSNVGVLRTGGSYFRQIGARSDATLSAVELDRARVPSGTPLTQLPLYPITVVTAGQYFVAARTLGSPAYTVTQLQHASSAAQSAADAQLLADGDVALTGVTASPSPRGYVPQVEGAVNGLAAPRGACVKFTPAVVVTSGAAGALTVKPGPGRVLVTTGAAPAAISVRRFAPGLTPLGTVQEHGAAIVSIFTDQTPLPWHIQLQSAGNVQVCRLSST